MNFEAIQEEIAAWIQNDTEVAAVYNYFNSSNFSDAWDVVSANEEIGQFVRWIESTGVDIIGLLNRLAERFGLTPFEPAIPTPVSRVNNRTWDSFVEAILALYPREEIHELFTSLKLTNPEFAQFLVKFDNLEGAFKLLAEDPAVVQVGADLRELGVDVDRLREALREFFGWE